MKTINDGIDYLKSGATALPETLEDARVALLACTAGGVKVEELPNGDGDWFKIFHVTGAWTHGEVHRDDVIAFARQQVEEARRAIAATR